MPAPHNTRKESEAQHRSPKLSCNIIYPIKPMKKIYLLPLFWLATLFVTSCEESTEAGKYDNWQARNQAFLDSLQQVYETAPDHGGLNYFVPFTDMKMKVYYKVKVKNEAGAQPVIPNAVSVYYRGSYYTDELFDQNFTGADPGSFDSPSNFLVSPVQLSGSKYSKPITGWVEVLQRMRVGERWTVYLPWQLAYGETGSGAILGYSALVFDMRLEAIIAQ